MTAGDRVYVVDVHIPDSSELSAPDNDIVPPPAGAFGVHRSQTPSRASPASSEGSSFTRAKRPSKDVSLSVFAVSLFPDLVGIKVFDKYFLFFGWVFVRLMYST